MSAGSHAGVIERLSEYARQQMDAFEIPGLQVALTDRDGLIASLEFGFGNLDAQAPVRPDTLFQIGSIGKSFTSICLLQLEAEGAVDLQQPIEKYLPWWSIRSEFEPFAIHHVMSHTAGLVSGTDFTPEQRFEVWSMRNTDTLSAPGTRFHYSNVGYKALGLVIEAVTGKGYREVVRERVLQPLGMTNSIGSIRHEDRSRLAVGYQNYFDDRPRLKGQGVAPAPWFETDSGDGCISASASDLAAYLRMFLNRGAYPGGRILTEAQFEEMSTPRIAAWPEDDQAYGYGLSVPISRKAGPFGHGGGMVGFISSMAGDLDTGFGAIAFTNSMNDVSNVTDYALDLLKGNAAGEPLPDLPETDGGNYSGIAGTWVGRAGEITFVQKDEEFVLERDGRQAPLFKTPYRNGTLIDDRAGANLFPYRFHRDESGSITEVVHGPEVWRKPDAEAIPDTDPALERLAGHYRSNNPWQSNFRIVARGSDLIRVFPWGYEHVLTRVGDAFTGDSDEEGPERFWIDVMVDGVIARVRDQLGSTWERSVSP